MMLFFPVFIFKEAAAPVKYQSDRCRLLLSKLLAGLSGYSVGTGNSDARQPLR